MRETHLDFLFLSTSVHSESQESAGKVQSGVDGSQRLEKKIHFYLTFFKTKFKNFTPANILLL